MNSAFAFCHRCDEQRLIGHGDHRYRMAARSTTHAASGQAAPSNPRPVSPLTGRGTTRDEKAAKG